MNDIELRRNVGHKDRLIRLFLGLALSVLGFSGWLSPGWTAVFFVLGLFQLITAALAY